MARILVIDDETNIRLMIRLTLQHVGHLVEGAADGPEGLNAFGQGTDWDLVLLDQRMPGMEGLDVLREICQRQPDARVIMITAFGTIDLAVDAMRAGARDFLRKPFTVEILRSAVDAALGHPPTDPARPLQVGAPLTFSLSTINGFWIESYPGDRIHGSGEWRYLFSVSNPSQEQRQCQVIIPAYIVELTRAYSDREQFPGGDRFWQALCEEVLANYLWQTSEFPPDDAIRIEDLTPGMRRWVDAVVAYDERR